ncbi:MAG: N-6 DNA methylase [Acidobacteria bacterium]|nr:N-6 DNA methylase [Acidobacteriota bacterium]
MTPPLHTEFQKADSLLRLFEEIHNYIYANDGLSPQQTLEEMVKLLFVKIVDETANTRLFHISNSQLHNLALHHQADEFQRHIYELFSRVKQSFSDVFDGDEKIHLSVNALAFTVSKLQNILLTESSSDAKGLALQKFLASRDKEGRGQFFTPEPIVDFCVQMMQPQPSEKIIDPACGSGGFLLSALRYLQHNFPEADTGALVREHLFGLDISKSIARIAKMKLLLEANGQVNIVRANALGNSLDALWSLFHFDNQAKQNFAGFDVVLTNPPFGTGGKITGATMLSQYDLAHKWTKVDDRFYKTPTLLNGQVAEILFIERCLALLREGGRLGVVLPNGHFENSSLGYVRDFIKQKAKVLAVIRLPQEAFIPFGTGVKTSLLFLEKTTTAPTASHQVFFGRVEKLGYQGNKNGTPVFRKDEFGKVMKDQAGAALLDEDFTALAQDYRQFQQHNLHSNEGSFALPCEDLNGRFDYDFYAPENRRLLSELKERNAVRLAEVAEIVKTKSDVFAHPEAMVEYVELSDVNTHAGELINSTTYAAHQLPSRASYELQVGDIITAVAGNSVGTRKHATALVSEEFAGCICTNGFRVLRNFVVNPYYLLYYFRSEFFLRQMLMYRTGAAIPSIADSDFASLLIYLPEPHHVAAIGQRMQKAFTLRREAQSAMDGIELKLN